MSNLLSQWGYWVAFKAWLKVKNPISYLKKQDSLIHNSAAFGQGLAHCGDRRQFNTSVLAKSRIGVTKVHAKKHALHRVSRAHRRAAYLI